MKVELYYFNLIFRTLLFSLIRIWLKKIWNDTFKQQEHNTTKNIYFREHHWMQKMGVNAHNRRQVFNEWSWEH